MGGDLFDWFGFGPGPGVFFRFGEVEAGDLESVEEEAGAAGIDFVGGDALEDLTDGVLDGGPVFGQGDFEGGVAGAAGARVWGGFAGGVVVIAEVFSAEAWAAAAVAAGEDVAALVAFGCFGLCVHLVPPDGVVLVQSLRRKGVESGLSSSDFAVKGEGPAFWPGLVFSTYV
jgi:hypothetical protein